MGKGAEACKELPLQLAAFDACPCPLARRCEGCFKVSADVIESLGLCHRQGRVRSQVDVLPEVFSMTYQVTIRPVPHVSGSSVWYTMPMRMKRQGRGVRCETEWKGTMDIE